MSQGQCSDDHPLAHDGTSQDQRRPSALSPDSAQLDDRKLGDMLVWVAGYARQLLYYSPSNRAVSDWRTLVDRDISVLTALIQASSPAAFRERFDAARIEAAEPDDDERRLEHLEAMGRVVIAIAEAVGTWRDRAVPDLSLWRTLDTAVRADLAPILDDIRSFELGVGELEGAAGSATIDFGLQRIPWAPGTASDAGAAPRVYEGRTNRQRLNSAVRRMAGLFAAAERSYRQVLAAAPACMEETLTAWPRHQPQMALLLAFLKLYLRHSQSELNRLIRGHLDFYYRDVLGLVPQPKRPDRAHILVTLARGVRSHALPAGTRFAAGKDRSGKRAEYALVDTFLANRARVEELMALHIRGAEDGDEKPGTAFFVSPIANSPTGKGDAFADGSEPRWRTFGDIRHDERNTPKFDREEKTVGLALASPMLYLAEGERTITVSLALTDRALAQEWQIGAIASKIERMAAAAEEMATSARQLLDAQLELYRDKVDSVALASITGILISAYRIFAVAEGDALKIQAIVRARAQAIVGDLDSTAEERAVADAWQEAADMLEVGDAAGRAAIELIPEILRWAAKLRRQSDADAPSPPISGLPEAGSSSSTGDVASPAEHETPAQVMDHLIGLAERAAVRARGWAEIAAELRRRFDSPPAAAVAYQLSTAKEWLPGEGELDVDFDRDDRGTLTLTIELAPEHAAVVGYDAEALPGGFPTRLPMLLLRFAAADYRRLAAAAIESISIHTSADRQERLVLHSDAGAVEAGKPFHPFGIAPRRQAALRIGSWEAFQKPLTSLTIRLGWQDQLDGVFFPADWDWNRVPATIRAAMGLAYLVQPPVDRRDTRTGSKAPEDKYSHASAEKKMSMMADADIPAIADSEPFSWPAVIYRPPYKPLYKSDFTCDLERLLGGEWKPMADNRSLAEDIKFDKLDPNPAHPDLEPFEGWRLGLPTGFVKLTLNTDLQHAAYGRLLGQAAMQAAAKPPPDPSLMPEEPWSPVLTSVTLDYVAQLTQELPRHDPKVLRLFHLTPFGHREISPEAEAAFTLVPRFELPDPESEQNPPGQMSGALYIGVHDLVPPRNLSLLFRVAEGSADPSVDPRPRVFWSYLRGDEWVLLDGNAIVSDHTDGLLRTGIVTLAVPGDADRDHRILPSGHHWLRAAVAGPCRGVSDMIGIHAQAAVVEFVDRDNDPTWLAEPLPAGSIAKLCTRDSAVKVVEQPYASFAGRVAEHPDDYHLRVAERLRHKDRAITVWDYERLVLEEFPGIYKVRCLGHTDRHGTRAPGFVTTVVIPRLDRKNAVDPLRPRTSQTLRGRIEAFLAERTSPQLENLPDRTARHRVIDPVYTRLLLSLDVVFYHGRDKGFYSAQLQHDLERYLSPWAYSDSAELSFERVVYSSSVVDFIEKLPYVDAVRNLEMRVGDRSAAPTDRAVAPDPSGILVSAEEHDINAVEYGREAPPAALSADTTAPARSPSTPSSTAEIDPWRADSMNVKQLQAEGLQALQALAGEIWTDHNVHDPGMTTLAVLCYALTDLAYRTRLPMRDLLAPAEGAKPPPAFFTAREILTCSPVTATDYRKLLVDIPGVRDAFIEVIRTDPTADGRSGLVTDKEPLFFADPGNAGLSWQEHAGSCPVALRGLYRVHLELDGDPGLGDLNAPWLELDIAGTAVAATLFSWTPPNGSRWLVVAQDWSADAVQWQLAASLDPADLDPDDCDLRTLDTAGEGSLELTLACRPEIGPGLQPEHELRIALAPLGVTRSLHPRRRQLLDALASDMTAVHLLDQLLHKTRARHRIVTRALQRLHQNRNLGDDFVEIQGMPVEEIGLCAEIEIRPDVAAEEVYAKICHALTEFFAPRPRFQTLQQALVDRDPSSVFQGPRLVHGFPDDAVLSAPMVRDTLHASDLIRIMHGVPGVIAVRDLLMTSWVAGIQNSDPGARWTLTLAPWRTSVPRFSHRRSKMVFYKGQIPYSPRWDETRPHIDALEARERTAKLHADAEDVPVPSGTWADLANYTSIQHHYALTYGIGPEGLAPSATPRRRARAKQFKAYLTFFDQILANHLAQLAHMPEILSVRGDPKHSLFTQPVYQIPHVAELLASFMADRIGEHDPDDPDSLQREFTAWAAAENDYTRALQELAEDRELCARRRNRILAHLLARFCESTDGYTALMHALRSQRAPHQLVEDHTALLHDYAESSYRRGIGYDQLRPEQVELGDNRSGLETRAARLLGMPPRRRWQLAGPWIEDVRVAEEDDDGRTHWRWNYELHLPDRAAAVLRGGETLEQRSQLGALIDRVRLFAPRLERFVVTARSGRFRLALTDEDGESIGIAVEDFAGRAGAEAEAARIAAAFDRDRIVDYSTAAIGTAEAPGFRYAVFLEGRPDPVLESVATHETRTRLGRIVRQVKRYGADPDRYAVRTGESGRYLELMTRGGEVIGRGPADATDAEDPEALRDRLVATLTVLPDHEEGFHVVEHILLRPVAENMPLMPLVPSDIRSHEDDGRGTCEELCTCLDPYSFRVTIILPYWPERFRMREFRAHVERRLRLETPAHLLVKICWVDHAAMAAFERAWLPFLAIRARWLRGERVARDEYAARLDRVLDALADLRTEYPQASLHDCLDDGGPDPVVLGQTAIGRFTSYYGEDDR